MDVYVQRFDLHEAFVATVVRQQPVRVTPVQVETDQIVKVETGVLGMDEERLDHQVVCHRTHDTTTTT